MIIIFAVLAYDFCLYLVVLFNHGVYFWRVKLPRVLMLILANSDVYFWLLYLLCFTDFPLSPDACGLRRVLSLHLRLRGLRRPAVPRRDVEGRHGSGRVHLRR